MPAIATYTTVSAASHVAAALYDLDRNAHLQRRLAIRAMVEARVQSLIDWLDAYDGDADLEPEIDEFDVDFEPEIVE